MHQATIHLPFGWRFYIEIDDIGWSMGAYSQPRFMARRKRHGLKTYS